MLKCEGEFALFKTFQSVTEPEYGKSGSYRHMAQFD